MKKTVISIVSAIVVMAIVITFIVLIPNIKYNKAEKLIGEKKYSEAYVIYESIRASDKRNSAVCNAIENALNNGSTSEAETMLFLLSGNVDTTEYKNEIAYQRSKQISNPIEALNSFKLIYDYKDCADIISEKEKEIFEAAKQYLNNGDLDNAETYLDSIKDNKGVEEQYKILYYKQGLLQEENFKYNAAKELFQKAKGYNPADKKLNSLPYGLIGQKYYRTGPSFDDYNYFSYSDIFVDETSIEGEIYTYTYMLYKFEGEQLYLCIYDDIGSLKVLGGHSNPWVESPLSPTNIEWKDGKVYSFYVASNRYCSERY